MINMAEEIVGMCTISGSGRDSMSHQVAITKASKKLGWKRGDKLKVYADKEKERVVLKKLE